MNFLLRNLENHLDEEILVEGEILLAQGRVHRLREEERHLWVATVAGDEEEERYEVEVAVTPSRVRSATCECEEFRRHGACRHYAAVLLTLRRRQQEQREVNARRQASEASPAKYTTAVVLENVPPADLIEFIRDYARRHRSFALALKARFANRVDALDPHERFSQLLESTVNLVRRPDRTINQRGSQRIVRVLEELREQREQALAEHHYSNVLAIIRSVIEKIAPVIGKVLGGPEELLNQVRAAFSALRQLTDHNLPPDLRRAIWEYSLEESPKLVYRNHGLDLLFFQLLLPLADEPEKVRQLHEALFRQREKYVEEGRSTARLLLLQFQLLEESGHPQAAARFAEEFLQAPEVLFPALEHALRRNQPALAEQLAVAALASGLSSADRMRLEDYRLRIARLAEDRPGLHRLLKQRFLHRLDPSLLPELRDIAGEEWESFRAELIEKLREQPAAPTRDPALIFLLAEAGDTEALLAALREAASLDLLRQYDRHLLPDREEDLLGLYRDLLTTYVENHLGPKSSRKIRQTLDHLNDIGMNALAARLVGEFRASYPERHTLMAELSPLNELPE